MENKNNDTKKGQGVAIIAYITWIGFIVALLIHYLGNKKTKFGAFHLRQMTGIVAVFIAGVIISPFPIIGWLAGAVIMVICIVSMVIGVIYAIQGKMKVLPYVGKYFQQWFSFIS